MYGSVGGLGGSGGSASGSAVCNLGLLRVEGTTLAEHETRGGNGGRGGSLPNYSEIGGSGGSGGRSVGGAIANVGNNVFVNCTLAFNRATGGSGGAPGYGRHGNGVNGSGGDGTGGALDNLGRVFATNCTFWGNTAIGCGGTNALLPGCGDVSGADRLGLASSLQTTGGVATLFNTIVGGDVSTNNCAGTILDGGHNLCSDSSAGFTAPGSLNSTDPRLGPLINNGGPTLTMALAPDSPAIDAGDDAACPATDQRGVPRPQRVHCDMGALEQTFLSIEQLPGGWFRVEYHGVPGQTYSLQASDNLNGWVTLDAGVADPDGVVIFQDIQAAGRSWRFFRASLP
jgi:hypothetical protein